MWCV
jgi:hypothetical protein